MARHRWRVGFRSQGVTADEAADELKRIREANEAKELDPHEIVSESRPEEAVLHPLFEWNDATAAEEYRLVQARRLTRAVYVIQPAKGDEAPKERPVYYHVEPNNYQPAEALIVQYDQFTSALETLTRRVSAAERALKELQEIAQEGGEETDRLTAITLAVQGFEAVRAVVAMIR